MVLSFIRKINMSPGQRDTGDVIDADDINELQLGLERIQAGTVPIPVAGIEAALGEYEPLANMRARKPNALDFLERDPDLSGGTDYTEELLSWLADAASGSAGSRYSTDGAGNGDLPPGVYGISGELTVDGWASLQGLSPSHTVFKALGADASIRFPSSSRGWMRHGGFTFDGNNLATRGVYVGTSNGVKFDQIHVYNCAGNGVEFHNAQNAVISGLFAESNQGSGVVVDDGTGSCLFLECHS